MARFVGELVYRAFAVRTGTDKLTFHIGIAAVNGHALVQRLKHEDISTVATFCTAVLSVEIPISGEKELKIKK